MPRKIYVLDTSAIIAGFAPGLADVEQVTVQKVLEEAKYLCSKLELEAAIVAGKVEVTEPSKSSLAEVRLKVSQTGDRVSDTDVELLALALDLRRAGEEPMLVTDDYAIQNLARLLGLPYRRVAMPGITEVLTWEMVCSACGRVHPATATQCEVCGSPLVRRPRR